MRSSSFLVGRAFALLISVCLLLWFFQLYAESIAGFPALYHQMSLLLPDASGMGADD